MQIVSGIMQIGLVRRRLALAIAKSLNFLNNHWAMKSQSKQNTNFIWGRCGCHGLSHLRAIYEITHWNKKHWFVPCVQHRLCPKFFQFLIKQLNKIIGTMT